MKEQILDLKKIACNNLLDCEIMAKATRTLLSEITTTTIIDDTLNVYCDDMEYLIISDGYHRALLIHHNGDMKMRGDFMVHNQRKIQQLLEPYWIDKPEPKLWDGVDVFNVQVHAEPVGDGIYNIIIPIAAFKMMMRIQMKRT